MFCSLEKLKIGMSASLLLGLFLTAHGKWIRGRLNSKYLSYKGKFVEWKECRNTTCGNDALNCYFAYTNSKECYQIYISLPLLLKWCPEKILTDDESMAIYLPSTDRAHNMTKRPRVWWFMDNVSKGRNFGSVGSAMDIPVGSVVWKKDAKGPRAGSPLLYGKGNYEKVALWRNGDQLLDMVEQFTISIWVKTDYYNYGNDIILGGVPTTATRFQFWPSDKQNQLTLAFNDKGNHHFTTRNNAGHNQWRHVAVAYNPGSSPIFFLNGDVWPLQNDPGDVWNKIQPNYLVMWKSAPRNYDSKFHGKIACVMVFQEALSQSQIKILKDNCP